MRKIAKAHWIFSFFVMTGLHLQPSPVLAQSEAGAPQEEVSALPRSQSSENELDTVQALIGDQHVLSFEQFAPEFLLPLPYRSDGMILSGTGDNYFGTVLDISRKTIVQGPQSMSVSTESFGDHLRIDFVDPMSAVWISLIRDEGAKTTFSSYNSKGDLIESMSAEWQKNDTKGVYRTFFVSGVRPKGRVKTIIFGEQNAFLPRVAGYE